MEIVTNVYNQGHQVNSSMPHLYSWSSRFLWKHTLWAWTIRWDSSDFDLQQVLTVRRLVLSSVQLSQFEMFSVAEHRGPVTTFWSWVRNVPIFSLCRWAILGNFIATLRIMAINSLSHRARLFTRTSVILITLDTANWIKNNNFHTPTLAVGISSWVLIGWVREVICPVPCWEKCVAGWGRGLER